MWSYEILGGTTVYLNEAKTLNLAVNAYYETHISKEHSDQKVGDIVTLEGGLGRSFAGGTAAVGIAYFAQWKVSSDDLGLGFELARDLDKHQIFGAGPELTRPLATKKT